MPTGPLVAAGTMLIALALAVEALAPSLWVMSIGTMLFGLGFGAIDTALNAHAARHFGAREINWMHASYGLGATIGPLLVTALLSTGRSWRQAYGIMALVLAAWPACSPWPADGWQAPRRRRTRDPASPPAAPPEPRRRRLADLHRRGDRHRVRRRHLGLPVPDRRAGPAGPAAGVAVSAYWAMMFAGRVVLGPVAERLGPARVLAAAVVGVPLGAALMAVPGPGLRWPWPG